MKAIGWMTVFLFMTMAASARAAAMADGFVPTVAGARIHYLEAGAVGAHRTILLVPGWRMSATIWSRQLNYFATQGYRVVAMDPRSQGGSTVLLQHNAPEDRAEDIQKIIAQQDMKHLILVGWSQGAQDVAAYVAKYGTDALDGIVLVDSPVSSGPADVRNNPGFVEQILKVIAAYSNDARAYTDGMMHAIITSRQPSALYASLDAQALQTPTDIGISMLVQDVFTIDRRPTLRRFNKPTLVVASAKSPLLDAQRAMLKLLPQARFVAVENAGHAVFVDQPNAFNHDLMEFIGAINAARSHVPAQP
ncbi:MAG: alpha/beta hydrolase [Pseudomonadota bacterium]